MDKQHFDAWGRKCYEWFQLKRVITHKPSLRILSNHMLYQLVIFPNVEIRIYKTCPPSLEMYTYGCGRDQHEMLDMNARRLCAFRRFYKRYAQAGWSREETASYVAFRREARVVVDPLRRFF